MKNEPDLKSLLDAAKCNDENAQNELFSILSERLLNLTKYILQRCCTFKSSDELCRDAEDIMQNTLIVINKKLKNTDFDDGFMKWVNRILRNQVGNYIQSTKTRGNLFQRLDPYIKISYGVESFQDRILADDYRKKIKSTVKHLGDECKKIILIFLNHGSRADVLETFKNKSISNIDSLICRCRRRLKKELKKYGYLL